MPFFASFPASSASAPGLFASSKLLQCALGVRESRLAQSLLGFVDVVHYNLRRSLPYRRAAEKAKTFTFASARTLAMWAKVPGRFSSATVSCFTLAMACLQFVAWVDTITRGIVRTSAAVGKDIR